MADMDVTAKFRADISDMKSKMDQISRSLDGMQKSTEKAQGGFTILKGAIGTAFGGAIIGGVYAAAKAVGGFATSAVDAASTMEELQSKVNAIFGPEAGADIAAWSETASKAFGQSQISAQNAASTFAVFGKGAGLAGDDLVGFSTELTELSSDLASFYDASPEDAITAIGAALRGESEPIRRFGVLLDDATLRQEALAQGLVKSTKDALNPQQRALAAHAVIMRQTADAQGDFARTSDGLANSQRTLSATIEDIKTQVGAGLLPAITQIVQAIGPMLQQLAGPLASVAEQIGGVLAQAFQQLAPILPTIATTFGQIATTIGGAMVGVLQTLLPALQPILVAFQSLAERVAPILSAVLGKVAEILGKVLSAVTPLLGPLTDLVMGILDAAWPIVEVLADTLMILVDALTPVLDAVVLIIAPLTDLIRLLGDVLTPVLQATQPVIEALANVLGQVLVKAVGLIIAGLGGLILGLSKIAPFVAKNVVKPVVTNFLNMAKGVVGAAADMLGWVPGLGDSLKKAESAITQFAVDTEKNIKNAGDAIAAEGERIGNEMITQGTNALNAAGPALGAAAARTGRYVAGQYNAAVASGMGKAWDYMNGGGATPPAPPPPPSPDPAPSPSGSPTGASKADEQEQKRLDRIQKFVDGFEKALERIQQGQQALAASTKRAGSEFAEALGDMLPESEIQQMFGPAGSIGGVISQYDQLDAAITDLYKPLMNAKRFGKEAANAAKANMQQAKSFLRSATQTALALMRAKDANVKAIEQADKDYSEAVEGINASYDALDRAAANNLRSIEQRWDSAIKGLESALDRASEAFDRENGVLQDLIKERDGFLRNIASGARSFLNNLTIPVKQAAKQIEQAVPVERIKRTITQYANGIKVTVETEVEPAMQALEEASGEEALKAADITSALNERLTQIREFAANIRTLVARGLDPTLVQDFVSAGVSGAGAAAAALAAGSDAELAAINEAQTSLAAEIADFQGYATQQWFDAGIAQQEAIVAPLAAARDQAQAALDSANAARTAEIAAAQAHAEALRVQRQQALDAAKAQYEAQKLALEQQGREIDASLTENANNLHDNIAALQTTVPPEMFKAGKKSVAQMLAGFREEFPGMKSKLNGMMDRLAASMNRTATVTITTVHRSVFEGAGPDGRRAMGGPVQAGKAYLVGERGPEMLIMGAQSGNVIPNHELGSVPFMGPRSAAGGGGTVINMNINAGMGADGAEVGRQVVEAIRKYERRSGPVFASA